MIAWIARSTIDDRRLVPARPTRPMIGRHRKARRPFQVDIEGLGRERNALSRLDGLVVALVTFEDLSLGAFLSKPIDPEWLVEYTIDSRLMRWRHARQRPPLWTDLNSALDAFLVRLLRHAGLVRGDRACGLNIIRCNAANDRIASLSCGGGSSDTDCRHTSVDSSANYTSSLGLTSHRLAQQIGFPRRASQSLIRLFVVLDIEL